MYQWQLRSEILDLIDKNCREIPYEGTEVDKYNMADDLVEFFMRFIRLENTIDD